jgi:hypothetical protein
MPVDEIRDCCIQTLAIRAPQQEDSAVLQVEPPYCQSLSRNDAPSKRQEHTLKHAFMNSLRCETDSRNWRYMGTAYFPIPAGSISPRRSEAGGL